MKKSSKSAFSLVMGASVLALASGVAQASQLSWVDEPIMGLNSTGTCVNGTECVPDSNTRTSQTLFTSLPPLTYIYALSDVNVDGTSTYTYERHATHLSDLYTINFGTFIWDGLASGGPSDYIAIVSSGFGDAGDLPLTLGTYSGPYLGQWTYTETWTVTAGDDTAGIGGMITSTKAFCVDDSSGAGNCSAAVPEPATLALLGLGLGGLGFGKRRNRV